MKPHERMTQARKQQGLSQQNLADATGLSKAHIWELEHSVTPLERASYISVCRIASALRMSVAQLMSETD